MPRVTALRMPRVFSAFPPRQRCSGPVRAATRDARAPAREGGTTPPFGRRAASAGDARADAGGRRVAALRRFTTAVRARDGIGQLRELGRVDELRQRAAHVARAAGDPAVDPAAARAARAARAAGRSRRPAARAARAARAAAARRSRGAAAAAGAARVTAARRSRGAAAARSARTPARSTGAARRRSGAAVRVPALLEKAAGIAAPARRDEAKHGDCGGDEASHEACYVETAAILPRRPRGVTGPVRPCPPSSDPRACDAPLPRRREEWAARSSCEAPPSQSRRGCCRHASRAPRVWRRSRAASAA
jgi:hypothetical protein